MNTGLLRNLFLGFIKIHILYHASKEKIFGKEFREELLRHGYDISFGTLYPVFHKLEKEGYLHTEKINVNGKIRKYYSITPQGEKVLESSREKARELFNELFEE
ncbi:MAG: PadR family transcriptional regulator [Deltaproteobacteria bacterium]|nr:helix-turn-helix transcriptional regulator [Deltaproteobacteria bacterium]MBW2078308.1 helix-turn-helix transcriptional regulator [Deltaproteobacteria bacterium]RLB32158.1 MAG: PadR family transcriptional regulator [Deltaproteobacteria bacterium]